MKASTVAILDGINREFYRTRAAEFSRTRKRPWPGWQRVFEVVERHHDRARIPVLDLGCGNGRLLPELIGAFGSRIDYLGIDASLPLLAEARGRRLDRASFVAADLVSTGTREIGQTGRFDLVLAFGLLHHLPSFALRRDLLVRAAELLARDGFLAVSFWQYGARGRFRSRILSWREHGVDPEAVERGDHLLAWGDRGAVRYCHFADPEEAEELVASVGLETVANFSSDGESGDLNLYFVQRKRG